MTTGILEARPALERIFNVSHSLEPVNGAAKELRDQTFGQNYALNVLTMEYAQVGMVAMLDFMRAVSQVMSPMGLSSTQDVFLRAR